MADVKDRPAASDDADLILKLQEKLDSLKNQVHNWTAKSKGKIFLNFLAIFPYTIHLYDHE